MSQKMIDGKIQQLRDARQALDLAKRKVAQLELEIDQLTTPDSLTDQEAMAILKEFVEHAKKQDEPFIDDDSSNITYYRLWVEPLPRELCVCDYMRFMSSCTRHRERIEPSAAAYEAMKHLKIGWSVTSHVSEHRVCGM
jgi:hypothetical protein